MPDNIIFYFTLLSQIILISFYYPRKILSQMQQMLTTYPPAEYPKLYPKPVEYYRIGQGVYRVVNSIILVLGFILIFAIGYWDASSKGKISEMLPFAFWGLQVIPILSVELLGYANFRLMRKADIRTTRNANLNPRRLFNFVSPGIVSLAVIMYVGCNLFFYSIHGFQFHPSNDTLIIFLSLTAMNLLFTVVIIWNLSGKKVNPHQAHEDRMRQIEISLKSLFTMSIVASVFLVIVEGIDFFDLQYLKSSLMSVYLQLTIFFGVGSMLRSIKVENLNFDVYKTDAPVDNI